MLIGVLEVDLYLPECSSLKEKRFILKSIKGKLRSKFNISVAESDSHELWQRSKIMVLTLSNDGAMVNSVLSKVVNMLEGDRRIQILDYSLRFL